MIVVVVGVAGSVVVVAASVGVLVEVVDGGSVAVLVEVVGSIVVVLVISLVVVGGSIVVIVVVVVVAGSIVVLVVVVAASVDVLVEVVDGGSVGMLVEVVESIVGVLVEVADGGSVVVVEMLVVVVALAQTARVRHPATSASDKVMALGDGWRCLVLDIMERRRARHAALSGAAGARPASHVPSALIRTERADAAPTLRGCSRCGTFETVESCSRAPRVAAQVRPMKMDMTSCMVLGGVCDARVCWVVAAAERSWLRDFCVTCALSLRQRQGKSALLQIFLVVVVRFEKKSNEGTCLVTSEARARGASRRPR